MTKKEYKEILNYELYGERKLTPISKLKIKYFQPNTNCMYLARKMWFLYNRGGLYVWLSKLLYLKILHRYGCIIYPNAIIGKGFFIVHPVGIVIGRCEIGEHFTIYHNATIGGQHFGDDAKGLWPHIEDNVTLSANSSILGVKHICSDVMVGAHSLVIRDILEPGTYVGSPVRKL